MQLLTGIAVKNKQKKEEAADKDNRKKMKNKLEKESSGRESKDQIKKSKNELDKGSDGGLKRLKTAKFDALSNDNQSEDAIEMNTRYKKDLKSKKFGTFDNESKKNTIDLDFTPEKIHQKNNMSSTQRA